MLKLIVVQAEYGDCFLLQSSDNGNSISILIDGGPSQNYQMHLKPTLDKYLAGKNLDLVILSHIDNDHILGLLGLFEKLKRESGLGGSQSLKIANLWHNSFSDLIEPSSDTNKLLQDLFLSNHSFTTKNVSRLAGLPALGALKGISEGMDLTKLSQYLHIPINGQFGGDLVVTKDGQKVIEIANIRFHILGPTKKNLEKLRKTWNR